MTELNVEAIGGGPILQKAMKAWGQGDIEGVLWCMSNESHIRFILGNIGQLKDRGLYEKALLHAYTSTRTNHSCWGLKTLRLLFRIADIEKLRKTGDPIPNQDTFTLYRGVSGVGKERRVNGFSWTESPHIAAWFAMRFSSSLPDPAVFTVTVPHDSVMACINDRNEREYLISLPLPTRPKRLKIMPEPFKEPIDLLTLKAEFSVELAKRRGENSE